MTSTLYKLHKLRCQGCGASVSVREGLRFVDCSYCGSRLEVVIPESKTAELSARCGELETREELRRLDAAWDEYLRSVSVKLPSGEIQPPGATVRVEGAMVGVTITIFAGVALAGYSLWWVLVVIPVAGTFATWLFISAAMKRERAFNAARKVHESKRMELVTRLGGRAELPC